MTMSFLKFHSACFFALKRAAFCHQSSLSGSLSFSHCWYTNPISLSNGPFELRNRLHTTALLSKDSEGNDQYRIVSEQGKTLLNKTASEQVDDLKKRWKEARESIGVDNVQWRSLHEDMNKMLKDLDPVAQSDEMLRQNLAELTQEVWFDKVRLVDNPTKRYKDWPVIVTSDHMKLVHDVKNKQYEAVLTLMRADAKQETYCIFRNQEGEKSRQEFQSYHDKLAPFYKSCPYTLNLTNLQELCTVIKEHPLWSVAHIGVAAKINGCYRVPEIQRS